MLRFSQRASARHVDQHIKDEQVAGKPREEGADRGGKHEKSWKRGQETFNGTSISADFGKTSVGPPQGHTLLQYTLKF